MRTIMLMKWEGVNPEQYEKLRKSVNWEGDMPKGSVFHVAAFSNNACFVTDIWESVDECNDFVQKRLMPATAAAGVKGEPHVEFYPVHAIFIPALQRLSSPVSINQMSNA